MADENHQDRTEQPTERRLEEAREKGQVARSRELGGAAVVLAGGLAFWTAGGWIADRLAQLLTLGLAQDMGSLGDPDAILAVLGRAVKLALELAAPVMGACLLAALIAPLGIGGIAFSGDPVAPKFERLDPIKGIGRLFSARSAMELVKTLGKFVLVAGAAVLVLWWQRDTVLGLGRMEIGPALTEAGHLGAMVFLVLASMLGVIAAIDVPFQLWEHHRQLKMTQEEVREELKQTEGRPEIKSKIRATQQAMSQRRMLDAVPAADVVVVNPVHFAVALRYTQGHDAAPVVVARGVDHMALRIRECARSNRVAVLEAPPLARALYYGTDIDQTIPRHLYLAVAQVLGWVYRLHAARRDGTVPPPRPTIKFDDETGPAA